MYVQTHTYIYIYIYIPRTTRQRTRKGGREGLDQSCGGRYVPFLRLLYNEAIGTDAICHCALPCSDSWGPG